jgi:hypothetical protein
LGYDNGEEFKRDLRKQVVKDLGITASECSVTLEMVSACLCHHLEW